MENSNIVFIGMDTHKETTDISYALEGRENAPVHLGKINTRKLAVEKMIKQFQSKYSGATLVFCYEAGPCGYWVDRLITKLGHDCYVVAPSLIPKKPGDRVKTDRRDSLNLARLLKQGDLQPIYVPEVQDEAIRDLSRAREAAMLDLKDAKYRLKALLLRNHIQYKGTSNWSVKHMRWLTEITLPQPAQQFVLIEMIHTITERQTRLERLDNELEYRVKQWRYYPVVKAIQAMRGIRLLVAVGLIAELGDLTRFDEPYKLMSYVGLTPSEYSSSDKRRLGGITKAGNSRARRLLVEGAHSYRYPAKISTEMQQRQEGLPKQIVDIGWKAQLRLCNRYQYLSKRGKHYNIIMTAIAREMIAFVWSISREVVLSPVKDS